MLAAYQARNNVVPTSHSELSEGLNLVFRWPFIVCSMLWNKKDKVYQNIWNGFQNDLIWSYQTFFVKKHHLGGLNHDMPTKEVKMVKRSGQQLHGESIFIAQAILEWETIQFWLQMIKGVLQVTISFLFVSAPVRIVYTTTFSDTRGILGIKMRVFEA